MRCTEQGGGDDAAPAESEVSANDTDAIGGGGA